MAVTEYREISKPNWSERVSGSFKGIITGVVMILGGIGLLFWNEGRAVKTAKALEEGSGAVVSVAADKIDPANEGKLVHVSAVADTKEILEDPTLGVKVRAIKLNRNVEIYQWVEHSKSETIKKDGKDVEKITYYYKREWCDQPVDSAPFKEAGHDNPPANMSVANAEMVAKDVTLGAFRLSPSNIRRIGMDLPYAFPNDYKLPEGFEGQFENSVVYIPTKVLPAAATAAATAAVSPLLAAAQRNAAASNAVASVASNVVRSVASNPQVGDLRIRLRVVLPHFISICQKQSGDSFKGWKASNGKMIDLQRDEKMTAEEMFDSEKRSNTMWTWVWRAVGFFLLLSGFKGVFGPIAVLVDVIPVLNGLIAMGVGIVSSLLAAIVWLCTVGVAWIFYRPVLGVSLLVGAVALVVFAISKKKKAPAAA